METTQVSKCLRFARKALDLMGHSDLELPIFRVVTRTGADWAGLHTYRYTYATDTGYSIIQIQRYVADGGDRSLERIVAHEMIHFVLFATLPFKQARRTNHGPQFLAYREQLNAVLGDDFVQLGCDVDFERGAMRKPIHLVMWKKAGALEPSIAWYSRETPKVRRTLMRLGAHPNSETRVVPVREVQWTGFPKLSTLRFAYARAHLVDPAKKLWDKAMCVVLPKE